MSNGKYFWLKLKEDFFSQDDIELIRKLDNGAEYIIFYQQLLLKSLKNNGELLFKDTIPYDEKMLSTITHTDIDVVRSALTTLNKLKLIEIKESGAIFMTEIEKMIGSETKWAKYKRNNRNALPASSNIRLENVQSLSKKCPIEIEKEIDIDKEKIHKKEKCELFDGKPLNFYWDKIPMLWNNILGKYSHIPKIIRLSVARKTSIRQRLRSELKTLKDWRLYFEWIEKSKFLREDCHALNFDWVLLPSNLLKIQEGKYHNGEQQPQEV